MARDPVKDREQKIQGYIAPYYKWALQQLVALGFEGVTMNDIVSNIVRDWLKEHADEHRGYGITEQAWLEARKAGPKAVAPEGEKPKAKLYRFTRDQETPEQALATSGDSAQAAL